MVGRNDPFDQADERLLHLIECQCGPGLFRVFRLLDSIRERRRYHDDVVISPGDALLILPERFAHEPFQAVSDGGLAADLPADRDAQPGRTAVVGSHEESKEIVGGTPIPAQNGLELAIAQQPSAFGKPQTLQSLRVTCETKYDPIESAATPHGRRYRTIIGVMPPRATAKAWPISWA